MNLVFLRCTVSDLLSLTEDHFAYDAIFEMNGRWLMNSPISAASILFFLEVGLLSNSSSVREKHITVDDFAEDLA